jgi:uroporphyrinogen decarboxylase
MERRRENPHKSYVKVRCDHEFGGKIVPIKFRTEDGDPVMIDRITDVQVALARRFVAVGVDGGYFGDDYGAQKGLLFSPETWRRLFKPRLARQFAVFREAGLPVLMHSDGEIASILPDLVEIGLTCLNPVQPEVLDHAWLKRTFGRNLAFYGGVSTQTVLPYGTPDEVRAAARECVRALAPHGTGLLLAPSHRMASDIPMANVDALLDVFAELEK